MAEDVRPNESQVEKYLEEVLGNISDPFHKRIIKAYKGDNPVQSMESELGKIVMEILNLED